jgi:hypothetical protein
MGEETSTGEYVNNCIKYAEHIKQQSLSQITLLRERINSSLENLK